VVVADVHSCLGCLHRVYVGCIIDVSEVHAASIVRLNVCSVYYVGHVCRIWSEIAID
jgi:hypothetical protein